MISGFGNNNIELLLQNVRFLEERPIRKLEQQKTGISDRITLFSDLKTKLSTLKSLADELKLSGVTSVYGDKAVTSSDETVLTASATSSASATTHTVHVNQLAKADKIVSNQVTQTATDIFSGLSLGAGTYSFDVTVNGTVSSVSVTVGATDDNQTILDNIVTAVNNTTGLNVSASVINDTSTTSRLVLTSDSTGSKNKITLADTTGNLLATIGASSSVALNGTSGGYVYSSSQLDALLTVDGVSITSDSNTIQDAVSGLTLNLLKTQATGDADITVNVSNDLTAIKAKIQEFIDDYNSVMDFIKTNTAVNTTTFQRSKLSGDFSITNLRFQLRTAISDPVTGLNSGDPTILSEIGLSTDTAGKLSIGDESKLDTFITDNLSQVEALFNSTDGIAGRLTSILDQFTKGDGIIQKRKDVLQSQINRLDSRIESMKKGVDRKIENTRQQFGQLQAAIATFSAQSNYLSVLGQSSFVRF